MVRAPSITTVKKWRPPRGDSIKINCDAQFNQSLFCGTVSCICRDSEGNVLTGAVKKIHAQCPMEVEANAIRLGTQVVVNLALEDVIIENDSLELVEVCRGNKKKHQFVCLIADIWDLKVRIQRVGFTWTPREGNGVAHELARLAAVDELPLN